MGLVLANLDFRKAFVILGSRFWIQVLDYGVCGLSNIRPSHQIFSPFKLCQIFSPFKLCQIFAPFKLCYLLPDKFQKHPFYTIQVAHIKFLMSKFEHFKYNFFRQITLTLEDTNLWRSIL